MFGLGLAMVCTGLSGLAGMGAFYFMKNSNNKRETKVSDSLRSIEMLIRNFEISNIEKENEVAEEEIHEPAKVISLDEVFSQYEQED